MPEEEPRPQPTDAVLGGTGTQPRPYDAVLGGKTRKEAARRIAQAATEKWTELDLSGLGLHELLPEIGKCTHLTGLKLSRNHITRIPKVLDQLSNLTSLNLNSNKITFIPDSLGRLSNLTTLLLNNTISLKVCNNNNESLRIVA
jgi:Leucine-rich repeat (LRR) protein